MCKANRWFLFKDWLANEPLLFNMYVIQAQRTKTNWLHCATELCFVIVSAGVDSCSWAVSSAKAERMKEKEHAKQWENASDNNTHELVRIANAELRYISLGTNARMEVAARTSHTSVHGRRCRDGEGQHIQMVQYCIDVQLRIQHISCWYSMRVCFSC